jgi:high-affinity iron transporter
VLDVGAFVSGLVTGLREGVEAALIVSIILAYLARTGNLGRASRVWLGVGSAVVLSAVLGVAVFVTIGELRTPYEQLFEGLTLLLAAVVVTWMLFWMRRQAGAVGGELRAGVDRAVSSGGAWGLAVLAFTAVIREGLETAIFLVGQATAASQTDAAGAATVLVGALAGLAIATLLGYGFYRGTRRIDLGRFFRWTGVALIFIAAGLLSQAVHEFVEIGIIPVGGAIAYDISAILPHEEGLGQFLRALFGYSSTPEVATLVAYLTYLAVTLTLYLRPVAARPLAARPQPEATPGGDAVRPARSPAP